MVEKKKTKALIDLPGTSIESLKRAINFKRLDPSLVEIVPIIVVGLRENSVQVAQNWVELYGDHGIKKIYWIWNNQDPAKSDTRTLPELPKNSPVIEQFKVPAIRPDIAKLLVSKGISFSAVLAGKNNDYPLLANMNGIGELGGWRREVIEAVEPLLFDLTK